MGVGGWGKKYFLSHLKTASTRQRSDIATGGERKKVVKTRIRRKRYPKKKYTVFEMPAYIGTRKKLSSESFKTCTAQSQTLVESLVVSFFPYHPSSLLIQHLLHGRSKDTKRKGATTLGLTDTKNKKRERRRQIGLSLSLPLPKEMIKWILKMKRVFFLLVGGRWQYLKLINQGGREKKKKISDRNGRFSFSGSNSSFLFLFSEICQEASRRPPHKKRQFSPPPYLCFRNQPFPSRIYITVTPSPSI